MSSSSESSMSDYSEDEAQVNTIIWCTLIYSMMKQSRQLAPFKNVNISFFLLGYGVVTISISRRMPLESLSKESRCYKIIF